MKLEFTAPVQVFESAWGKQVDDPAILRAIDGWAYGEKLGEYFGDDLADIGIIGGDIRARHSDIGGLRLIVEYWSPAAIDETALAALLDFTRSQLSDGAGKGGFTTKLDDCKFLLCADEGDLTCNQFDDGKQVPLPSPIPRAARDGDMDALQRAIESGYDVDAMTQGHTGLQLAILFARREAALLLIESGANPTLIDQLGCTPLHLCALSNELTDGDSAALAKALLRAGADQSLQSDTGESALGYARGRGKTMLAAALEG